MAEQTPGLPFTTHSYPAMNHVDDHFGLHEMVNELVEVRRRVQYRFCACELCTTERSG